MTEQTHLGAFAAFVMSDDNSELGMMKAERDYALHCLEREIAICAQTHACNEALVKALKSLSNQCGNVIYNCQQKPAENQRHLDSWKSVKEFADAALASIKGNLP